MELRTRGYVWWREMSFFTLCGETRGVEAVEAGGECMLLPSGTDREESNSVEVLSAGGECKFLNGS